MERSLRPLQCKARRKALTEEVNHKVFSER